MENILTSKKSREACRCMHVYGNFEISGTRVTGITLNQTITRPITLAGHVDNGGACSGSAYSDPYGTWTDVVVMANIKITLQDYTANVQLNSNRIQLRSGVACGLSYGSCTDIEGGHTFWNPVPDDSCKFADYSAIYQGYADEIIDNTSEYNTSIYHDFSKQIFFYKNYSYFLQ